MGGAHAVGDGFPALTTFHGSVLVHAQSNVDGDGVSTGLEMTAMCGGLSVDVLAVGFETELG